MFCQPWNGKCCLLQGHPAMLMQFPGEIQAPYNGMMSHAPPPSYQQLNHTGFLMAPDGTNSMWGLSSQMSAANAADMPPYFNPKGQQMVRQLYELPANLTAFILEVSLHPPFCVDFSVSEKFMQRANQECYCLILSYQKTIVVLAPILCPAKIYNAVGKLPPFPLPRIWCQRPCLKWFQKGGCWARR